MTNHANERSTVRLFDTNMAAVLRSLVDDSRIIPEILD